MTTPHPSLPAQTVEQTLAEIAQLEQTLADLGPREAIVDRVIAAQNGMKARTTTIEKSHGIPLVADHATGSLTYHPALGNARAELHRARELLSKHNEAAQRLNVLRKFLETGSMLARPFRSYSAPSEIGRLASEGRGLRLTAGPDGKPRIERVSSDRVKICEVDGPSGVARRRARNS